MNAGRQKLRGGKAESGGDRERLFYLRKKRILFINRMRFIIQKGQESRVAQFPDSKILTLKPCFRRKPICNKRHRGRILLRKPSG